MNDNIKKKVLPLVIMAILFFGGIASILYPLIGNIVTVKTAKTVIAQYDNEAEDLAGDEFEALFETARDFNENLFHGTLNSDEIRCLNRGDDLMCYVDVPLINVYLPVYYGTSEAALKKGCGYLENTSLPVGGENTHCVIAGHTGLPTAEMLTKLDEVGEGDVFYIHILGEVLAYKIDKISTVLPDKTETLNIVPGEDRVTLLTCTPYGVNDHRLLVSGVRVPYDPENDAVEELLPQLPQTSDDVSKEIGRQATVIAGIAVAAIIVFLIACIVLRLDEKKKNGSVQIDDILVDDEPSQFDDE